MDLKYLCIFTPVDSPRPQQLKKIKVEPLELPETVASAVSAAPSVLQPPAVAGPSDAQDDTLALPMEVKTEAAIPQQYIDENGDVIKIVRMRQEEIINCLCHYPEEDGLMIQCDLCLCWQHGRCNDIEKESQVPDKYVCYICRNPEKGRQSMKYVHDQDWLYDGKLPRGTYHTQGTANDAKRTETLKTIHTLTGNLLELKRLMHGLRGKMNIADNKDHPKLYLWSKRWENADGTPASGSGGEGVSPQKGAEERNNAPKPEAAIDSRECQRRLMEHIKNVQSQLNRRLDSIEVLVDQIEGESEMGAMTPEEDAKCTPRIKQTMHMMMDDLATMKEIAQC